MKNNDHDDRQEDHECLPPELAAFELQLKSLKPVAPRRMLRRSRRDRPASIPSLRYASFRLLLVVAGMLLIALTWFGLMRLSGDGLSQPVVPGNEYQIAENTMPASTTTETQAMPIEIPIGRPAAVSGGGLSMRKQLAMLLDEMQPTSTVAMEPKRPDYPVMIIPVRQDAPPLSPEAKQAFQQRLQRIDPSASVDDPNKCWFM